MLARVVVAVVLAVIAGLLVVGMKLAAYRRDPFGVSLLIALPIGAVVLAAAITVLVIRDWAAYTDCVGSCDRPAELDIAFVAANVSGYGFGLLLIIALVRAVILQRRESARRESAAVP